MDTEGSRGAFSATQAKDCDYPFLYFYKIL